MIWIGIFIGVLMGATIPIKWLLLMSALPPGWYVYVTVKAYFERPG